MTEQARVQFAQLQAAKLKTARAWAIKESLRALWDCPSEAEARAFWKRWTDYFQAEQGLEARIHAANQP